MTPRIFYYAYSTQNQTGGQKQTYHHVDALNQAGLEAYVYHERENFRVTWFSNETAVAGPAKMKASYSSVRDYLVLPEGLAPRIASFPGKKVIFNKGVFKTFRALPAESFPPPADPYEDPSVVCAFVVSEHSARQLRYAYPDLAIVDVGIGIDQSIFRPTPLPRKSRRIACVAKCLNQVNTICGLLAARLHRDAPDVDVQYTLLRGLDEHQVSDVLSDSLILLMCSWEEGLPQTLVEGLLSGCIVTAPETGSLRGLGCAPPLDFSEPARVADHLYRILLRHPHHPDSAGLEIEERRAAAVARWSLQAERVAVRQAWERILGSRAEKSGA